MFCRPKDRYLVGGATGNFLETGESRRIARMSGADLWKPWTGPAETILIPDELDMQRGFNRFYGMSARWHEGIYWGALLCFKLNTDITTELAWSRDGRRFERLPLRPKLLALGPDGAWDDGMVYGSADWVEMGDRWYLYYAGHDGPHETPHRTPGIGLATLRKEGFVSLRGPRGGGVVCTRLLRWPGGGLKVNADASKGEMRVRVSDEKRRPLDGFGYEDMETFTGDSTAIEVEWRGKSLNELQGRAIRLEFHLRDADLSHTPLRGKDLRFAAGGKAKLIGSDLRDSNLSGADFQRAILAGADLESAHLHGTDLDSADFVNACLRKTIMRDADMEDVSFRHAYLGRADLRSRLLTRADFAFANLNGADLRGANLAGANFQGASLRCFISHKLDPSPQIDCANLEGAVLRDARFEGADLQYAAGLTQAQLSEACGDAETRLPAGFRLPACPPHTEASAHDKPEADNPCVHEIKDDRWPQ